MCAVSAVTDYYREKWPLPSYPPSPDPTWTPNVVIITQAQWNEYQELKRRMAEYDVRTEQPDCEKPDVTIWEEAIKNTYLAKDV